LGVGLDGSRAVRVPAYCSRGYGLSSLKESAMDDDASALEEYLRTAEIDHYGTFAATAGGGHPSKEFVLVRGGIGALAKLATTDDEARQCKSEVGAYVLAHLLGWDDLVPQTHLALIDNGRTLISGYPGVSGFAHHCRGQLLTDDHAQRLESFIGGAHDRLVESVGDHEAMQIVQRARRMIDDAVIVVDT
jgi:hypothetical protein